MYSEIVSRLSDSKRIKWERFISKMGLVSDSLIDKTVLVWNGDDIIATGSRYDNILKLIAVDPLYQGEDLTSTVVTALRRDAFENGYRSLFLYTKPQNEPVFSSLFFHLIARTESVLLLEDKKDGIGQFIASLPKADACGKIGTVVMNCNPFTLGHQYLIEHAASECEHLYIFILSEDKSLFPAADRMEMVRLGTSHISNVSVLPTGPYLISSATFPTYFLKDRDKAAEVQCRLDIEIFARYFVPAFGITHRYVGSEPLSALTSEYNHALAERLPIEGVELIEIQRKEYNGSPISASAVRTLIAEKNFEELRTLLPQTTIDYISKNGFIK